MTPPTLDRRDVLLHLLPDLESPLFVSGLAGASKDMAALTDDGANLFTMAGTMGAAVSFGLGMALSAPDRDIIVVTGDGELLMNVGALATVATAAPENLAIICMDNGCHGETGGQTGHTSHHTDLGLMAKGAGISDVMVVEKEEDFAAARALVADGVGPRFVHLRIKAGPPSAYRRNFDLAECRLRFRSAVS